MPPPTLARTHLGDFRDRFQMALDAYDYELTNLKAFLERDAANLPKTLIKKRANEAARSLLPNACETRLVWSMNTRAARWVIEQRGAEHADLEIRRLAWHFATQLKQAAPLLFRDVEPYIAADGFEAVRVEHSKV